MAITNSCAKGKEILRTKNQLEQLTGELAQRLGLLPNQTRNLETKYYF